MADVVEEADLPGLLLVVPDLGRDHPGDGRGVLAVAEHVVAVRVAKAQRPEELGQLGVNRWDAELLAGGLPLLLDALADLAAALADHLLDAGRVDPAVGEEALQRDPRHLSPDRVEPAEDDRFRGVVDDDVDARRRLERADVAALAAD